MNKWTVVGPGAMGCLWAWYLQGQGHQVHLLGRKPLDSPHVILSYQNTMNQALADQKTFSYHSTGDLSTHLTTARLTESNLVKNVLICTKAFDAAKAFLSIKPFINPLSQVVILCNGIEAQQQLARQYPGYRLYALVTTQGAYLEKAFQLIHAGNGKSQIGPLTESAKSFPILDLPLDTQWQPNILQALLNKLSINAIINPLTVFYQCKNGDLLEPKRAQMLKDLANEVETILNSIFSENVKNVYQKAKLVAQQTSENYSSSYQDVINNRKTELMAFTGFLHKEAINKGLAVPIHHQLMDFFTDRNIQL